MTVGQEALRMRCGIGMDVHAFAAAEDGRRLVIGGVDVPYERGLAGHSDADVLAHAIADALLGAARIGDIGKLFPDTDPAFKDADSLVLLSLPRRRPSCPPTATRCARTWRMPWAFPSTAWG